MKLPKMTLRNAETLLQGKTSGFRFTYAFSTLSFQCVKIHAARAGLEVRLIEKTLCEIL